MLKSTIFQAPNYLVPRQLFNFLFTLSNYPAVNSSLQDRVTFLVCLYVRYFKHSLKSEAMETILEQQRRYHEERERLMDVMVKEMLYKKAGGSREQINSDHRLKMLIDHYMESTNHLKELYEDKDGLRKEEVAALSGPHEFTEFYSRLKAIKDFYRRHPNEIGIPMSAEFEELAKMRENPTEENYNMVEFTDEEGYGKYLDLHECYYKFLNLKGIDKIDYIAYLTTFDHLYDIPKDRKNAEYRKYLESVVDYLHDFIRRIKPLYDLDKEYVNIEAEFQTQWENGTFPGKCNFY